MDNKYERGINNGKIVFLNRGVEKTVELAPLLEMFGVKELVRIPDAQYPNNYNAGDVITHFGLPIHNIPGKRVVLSRIMKTGFFLENGTESLPVLSFNDVWIAEKVKVIESIAYEDIQGDYFENTVGSCSDTDELRKLILSRYRNTLPDLEDEQILSQGVSIRSFKLLENITFGTGV